MQTRRLSSAMVRAGRFFGLGLLLFCAHASAADGIATARSRTVTPHFRAYANVVPIAVAQLHAAQVGQVQDLNVDPGQHVAFGDILGKLSGPEINAVLAQHQATVANAKAALTAARHTLAIERQKRSAHLSTRQAVYNAQAALTQAKARLAAAQSALQSAKQSALLRAPGTGTVASLAVANGERIAAGQTVLTLQPDHHLWLRAVYYGADAGGVHVGMRGRFVPADGAPPITVRVARILPGIQPDDGRPVGLRADSKEIAWTSGEAGTVTVDGPQHTVVAIPTRALILDRSRWWVLVHTPGGNRRQTVTPGASRGHDTLIEQGLSAGTQVVVDNAYLEFHRDFSQHFQPPD